MKIELIQGLAAMVVIIIAGIGWSGYWNEFQRRIQAEEKIKKFYGE